MQPGETVSTALAGHQMFNRIEDSRKPYIAAIHGACMGGGLELSLACAGRICFQSFQYSSRPARSEVRSTSGARRVHVDFLKSSEFKRPWKQFLPERIYMVIVLIKWVWLMR